MSMTRQEQLDAVVRNYGFWFADDAMAAWIKEDEKVIFFKSDEYCEKCSDVFGFTRSEVEARKAELQNKPSWDDAPTNAEMLIQADDGDWQWILEVKHLTAPLPTYEQTQQYSGRSGEVIGDWRDTLEKRSETKPDSATLTDEGTKWSGEGLPHVGVVCTIQLAFNDIGKCKITYMGDGVFCYRQLSSGEEYTGSISDTIFRPIQTDLEKWIDLVEQKTGLYIARSTLEAIYDAGLAKIPE